MKLTRRQMAAAALAALGARAQTPAQPQAGSLTPDAELANAKDQVKATATLLENAEVPMTTTPAFVFRA